LAPCGYVGRTKVRHHPHARSFCDYGRLGYLEGVRAHRLPHAGDQLSHSLVIDGLAMRADDEYAPRRDVCGAANAQGSVGEEFAEEKVKLAHFP
jgi:hypothetical protein